MKWIFSLLTLLISAMAIAGPAQVNSVITVGNCTIPSSQASNLVYLHAGDRGITTTDYYSLFAANGSGSSGSAYQVPTGKTFTTCKANVFYNGSTNMRLSFGYGTAAVTSAKNASPPTGNFFYGDSGNLPNGFFVAITSVVTPIDIYPSFPSLSYPYAYIGFAGSAGDAIIDLIGLVQ